ncbi:hypothetical protein APHAL10511_000926 [Amanita phalloides]|nr:hypothetical protein APHAL10511_000926 [Amanita phalloides]
MALRCPSRSSHIRRFHPYPRSASSSSEAPGMDDGDSRPKQTLLNLSRSPRVMAITPASAIIDNCNQNDLKGAAENEAAPVDSRPSPVDAGLGKQYEEEDTKAFAPLVRKQQTGEHGEETDRPHHIVGNTEYDDEDKKPPNHDQPPFLIDPDKIYAQLEEDSAENSTRLGLFSRIDLFAFVELLYCV